MTEEATIEANDEDTTTRVIRRAVRPVFLMLGVILGLVVLVGAVAIGALFVQAGDLKAQTRRELNHAKGQLVAVCAVPNVNSIRITNFGTLLEEGLRVAGVTNKQLDTAFAKLRDDFIFVDCKTEVSKDDRVKLCLQYPPLVTIRPSETTTTTEFQPACEPTAKP